MIACVLSRRIEMPRNADTNVWPSKPARRVYARAARPPKRTRACASPVTCRDQPSKHLGAIRSDRLLELLGGAERDLLARLDLDRLAGGRIASHARRALPDLQDAEPADADAVALLQVLADVGH